MKWIYGRAPFATVLIMAVFSPSTPATLIELILNIAQISMG